MKVAKREFGMDKAGNQTLLYTITNDNGMQVEVTNYGAILVNVLVPDKKGNIDDVVLGYDTVEGYLKNPSFFGATIGPSANRIANASFIIEGTKYILDANDGNNNLHSHKENGYHKQLWEVQEKEDGILFRLKDEDGNMGFPGEKEFSVSYTLNNENELKIEYKATSDKLTVINPTNHTYFNLDGHNSDNIEAHELQLNASYYTPVISGSIPTGEIAPVKGTPMDFTVSKTIGKDIKVEDEQLKLTGGYDHNWVIDHYDGQLRECATVLGPKSGRKMICYTTLPGVQFYAGNFITPEMGKKGAEYVQRSGLCLETQFYPNSANQLEFPSCIFGKDKEYHSVTTYKFM